MSRRDPFIPLGIARNGPTFLAETEKPKADRGTAASRHRGAKRRSLSMKMGFRFCSLMALR